MRMMSVVDGGGGCDFAGASRTIIVRRQQALQMMDIASGVLVKPHTTAIRSLGSWIIREETEHDASALEHICQAESGQGPHGLLR